jgi:hypothetical protein
MVISGCVVRSVLEAAEVSALGADFLLIPSADLQSPELSRIASLGLPWFLHAGAAGAAVPAPTGILVW